MAARTKFMIAAGFAVAGLGFVGAGAGATFTSEVSATTGITSGSMGLSLNGATGSDLSLNFGDKTVSSHFEPVSQDLRLKNTGTLDMASTFLKVTANGCDGGEDASLAQALHVTLTDVTNDKEVYDGSLCSLVHVVSADGAGTLSAQGFSTPPQHANVGGQLPHVLAADKSILYRIVIQPKDSEQGLPTAAQDSKTSVNLVFSGFDY